MGTGGDRIFSPGTFGEFPSDCQYPSECEISRRAFKSSLEVWQNLTGDISTRLALFRKQVKSQVVLYGQRQAVCGVKWYTRYSAAAEKSTFSPHHGERAQIDIYLHDCNTRREKRSPSTSVICEGRKLGKGSSSSHSHPQMMKWATALLKGTTKSSQCNFIPSNMSRNWKFRWIW